MNKAYATYYWKKGKPYGEQAIDPLHSVTYKIITDPYGKRYSVERYQEGQFEKIVYDSLLLDFRHLNPVDQTAWQRESLQEGGQNLCCLLRNQDDRAILLEKYTFEGERCRQCEIYSIHGLHLATQRLYYQALQDSFDGVVFYDIEKRPVMLKRYQVDSVTGEFTELLQEEWDMQSMPALLRGV